MCTAQGPGPAGPAQGLKVPELTLRAESSTFGGGLGRQGCQGGAVPSPSEANQPHPTAPQGEPGRAGNQAWPQPGHPQAPPQAPGLAGKAAPRTGWGWGRAVSGLEVRPGPSSAESLPNAGVGPGCILPAAQGCLAMLPYGPKGTGLPAVACSELASSPNKGTPPGP